ncbi:MAG: hypothetical protein C4299_04570 [Thermoleophilia bacterium]
MQADLNQLFDRALAGGVRIVAERYGFPPEAMDGAITRPTLEAALEVLPPPHRRFAEEHLDYYQRRLGVLEREGAEAALVVWSLEEPLVWLSGMNRMPDLDRLPWRRPRPLREDFRDVPPLLTPDEARRLIGHILRAEGHRALETPVLLPPETERVVEAVAARMRVIAQGRTLEGTARLIVERSLARWQEEGERPQAVAVVDVGGPIPVLVAFDDPRPLRWDRAVA